MKLLTSITDWWHQRIINRSDITDAEWNRAISRLPILIQLTPDEIERLKAKAILLIHKKTFSGAHDLMVTRDMQLIIALQACLPILNLDIGWYKNWVSIIVYPSGFWSPQSTTDHAGVSHSNNRLLSGEAWHRGPLILSWTDTETAGNIDGDNLVIHEFAHKLDLMNGAANGYPPLHKGMNHDYWVSVFNQAYQHFVHHLDDPERSEINRYAAYSPGEFFAVFSEVFFEHPWIIDHHYPEVYQLMCEFYRQDPLPRFAEIVQRDND